MKISCVKRDETGSGASNKLRREDFIPGVVYGKNKTPESISLSRKDMDTILKELGSNAILDLEMNGKPYHVMLKDIQKDAILGNVLHADFMQVGKDQKVVVAVPVHLENAESLHNEGALVHHLDYVEAECLSDSIPKSIHLDVAELKVGEHFTVAELVAGEGVKILNDPEEVVVSLSQFRVEEEESEEEERTEPVLIGEEEEETE
ncbi:50S ribosomal protein L25 [Alkalibacter mobilis]|uniref:50S ribosomal protein L25 n=1 Tax=Alkalibacter mobilis TaxID=2787712 RepID=UPI00189D4A99|nr:50S ribosomal protein L25 [Alkalibacter mobilis]MBF7095555.1 50S ribosomal protein L25 [Alkalibacter mobilis]